MQVMHQLLTAKQADSYRPFQDLESKKLVYDLLHDPEKSYLHNRRYSNSGFALHMKCPLIGSYHVGRLWAKDNG